MKQQRGGEGPIEDLVRKLARLPGLGGRSARRIALHLLQNREKTMEPLIEALAHTAATVVPCGVCGNLDFTDPCHICADAARDRGTICVVAQVGDVWAIERTRVFRGTYHVLGGLLSALDGVRPEHLSAGKLRDRVHAEGAREVILALSMTVDGQTTAHYVADLLKPADVKISRLAHGVPVGGELDYLDDGTIITALKARAGI